MQPLTEAQRQELESTGALRLVDPQTTRQYVAILADVYDSIAPFFEDAPLSLNEQRYMLREIGTMAGWNDPEMDIYDELDPRKP